MECVLHSIAPDNAEEAATAIVLGLSLCNECAGRAVEAVVVSAMTAPMLLRAAQNGRWIEESEW